MGIIINGQNDTIGPVDNTMSLLGTVSIGGTMTIEDFTNIDSVGLITARNGLRVNGDYLRVNTNVDSPLELNATDDGPVYSSLRRSGTRVAYYGFGGSSSTFNITNEVANGQLIIDTPSHFSVNTNNAERIRVTSAGNVGINETSPDTYLHVKTGTDSALAKLEQTATNGRVQVQYLSPHGDWLQGIVGASNSGDYLIYTGQAKNLTFYTSGALRQKIQSDGKVILGGNANQAANRDLSVVAASGNSNEVQIGLQPTNSSGGYNPEVFISAIADGSYGAHMYFKTRDTSGNRLERLRITSAGKIGIGVGTPDQMMEITNTGGTGSQIQLRDTSTGTGSGDGARFGYNGSGAQIWNFENTYIRFATNNTERLRIESDGNIVLGYGGASLYFQNGFNNSNSRIQNGGGSNNSNLRFYTRSSGTEAERLRIQSDGNVIPFSNGAHNLGLSGNRWNKVWTNYVRYGTRSATYEKTFTATSDGSGNLTFECGVLWLIDDSSFEVFCHIDRTGSNNNFAARYKFYGSKVSGFGTQGTYRYDTSNFYIISPVSNPTIDAYTPAGHGSSHGTRIAHTGAVANAEYRLTMLIHWVGQQEVT